MSHFESGQRPNRFPLVAYSSYGQSPRIALYMRNNIACLHKTLRVTPAMVTGVAEHVWSLEEAPDWHGGRQ